MLLIIIFIVIISINNNYFIILPRPAKTDVCDTCAKIQVDIGLPPTADIPGCISELELQWEKHQEQADQPKDMLKKAVDDGPARLHNTYGWRTICTGK